MTSNNQDKKIISDRAPEPVGAYPHARRVGDLLFLSGVGPRKKNSKEIPGVTLNDKNEIINYDIEIQTHSVINNIKTILEDSGLALKNLVDVQVYLTNMKNDFKTFNKVYAEYFNVETGPCRTTIEVGALPTPIAVEIKALAKF
jgi:2-aminomuconate deaminase